MFVEEGNDVEEVERLTQGRGRIEKEQTAEMLFFPRDGDGMIDYQDGDSSLETDSLEGISSSSIEILTRIANSSAIDVVSSSPPGSIAHFVRKTAVYPLIWKPRSPVVSSGPLTGRGNMFVVVDGEGEEEEKRGRRTLVLFKEGNSPEEIERVVLERRNLSDGEASRLIVFGRAGEGVSFF